MSKNILRIKKATQKNRKLLQPKLLKVQINKKIDVNKQ